MVVAESEPYISFRLRGSAKVSRLTQGMEDQGVNNNMPLEAVCVKEEVEAVCVKTEPGEVCVKEEPECEDNAGVSAAAARAGLYTDHEVKDELVLGPEEWHRPKVHPVQVYTDGGAARAREQLAMACSVVLERLCGDATVPSRDIPYTCEHCGKRFKNRSILRKHIRHTHLFTQTKRFACDFCMSAFQTKLLVVEHEKTEHCVTHFMCAKSEYTTNYKKTLVTDLKGHSAKTMFSCKFCSYKSLDKSDFHKHQMIHTTELQNFKCRQKCVLKRHRRKYDGEKPYKCNHCDYKCSRRPDLQRHIMTHTGAKPFRCNDCDYKCSRKEYLLVHQRIHTGHKPYTCSNCDYTCSHRSALQRHQVIHTEAKPFKCTNCYYKCSRKERLQVHQRIHTQEKPYQCSHCEYKCSDGSSLRKHERTHSGEKPFLCSHCDYASRHKKALRRHLQSKHSGQ